jgi:5-methylcytosine-specific restriction endonuclease McrA
MNSKIKTIESICSALQKDDREKAKNLVNSEYPFSYIKPEKRKHTPKESMDVFIRDGFIDRYSGSRLSFPGVLRLIHKLMPNEFPFHSNWKMSETLIAFWELFPTIDHIIPIARGGKDASDNSVTTSQLRNSAKSNWLIEELNWQLVPSGNIGEWDGLTSWFLAYLNRNPEHLSDSYINTWYKVALEKHKQGSFLNEKY